MKKKRKNHTRPFWASQPVKRNPLSIQEKIDRVIAAVSIGALKPGTVTHVSIQHDQGCPALQTGNLQDCTCDPDISLKRANS